LYNTELLKLERTFNKIIVHTTGIGTEFRKNSLNKKENIKNPTLFRRRGIIIGDRIESRSSLNVTSLKSSF
jgi:hypothetical protein